MRELAGVGEFSSQLLLGADHAETRAGEILPPVYPRLPWRGAHRLVQSHEHILRTRVGRHGQQIGAMIKALPRTSPAPTVRASTVASRSSTANSTLTIEVLKVAAMPVVAPAATLVVDSEALSRNH